MFKKTFIASAISLLATPLAANAVLIDFESVTTPSSCDVNPGGSVDGFTLSPYNGTTGAGFNNSTGCDFIAPTAHSGTQYMVNYNRVYGQFTRDSGTFDLTSLWVHADIRSGQTTVRFQGLDGPGGNVLYSQDVVVDAAWQQVTFSGWTGVKTLTWEPISPDVSNVSIDDVVYDGSSATLTFNRTGVGHILYVPYFSTQEGNVTAVNVVNTDTVNGKVLKVRFRGASNSDDVYDFQVFLSPGDVWTAGISQGSDGRSRLDTADKSCTLPANVNGAFIASRTPSAGGNAETREGYIEILTMADIVRGDADTDQRALYTATKHVKGVAPCTSSVLTALTHENAGDYMAPPTTGIMANWTIINVSRIVAYSGDAAAIEARASVDGEPVAGRIVYWDQRPTPLTPTQANANTADPLLRGASPVLAGARYDLPDLSTPYLTDVPNCPFCQSRLLSDAITATEIAGEFYSEASVGAQTDWVVSFPTRRYFAAVRYTGTSAPAIVRNATSDGNIYFTADNTELGNSANGGKAYQICTKLGTNAVAFYDREETPTIVDDIVISPGTPTQLSICGEVSVVGLNNASAANSATFGSVARSNVANGFTQGWGSLTVPQGGNGYYNGLPMLARQFTRVNNTQTNVFYGLSYEARVLIPGTPPPFSPAP